MLFGGLFFKDLTGYRCTPRLSTKSNPLCTLIFQYISTYFKLYQFLVNAKNNHYKNLTIWFIYSVKLFGYFKYLIFLCPEFNRMVKPKG